MTEMVVGPLWSAKGLDIAAGRYPLRVETHVSQMVDRLLPGVTTVTTQARYFLLHPLVWAEASRRSLDLEAARQLLRRCEVVIAAVSALHEPHDGLPTAHGADLVGTSLSETGVLRVADLQAIGRYSAQVAGFAGTYRGSEERLGLLAPSNSGFDQPGSRFQSSSTKESLRGLFELADQNEVSVADLQSASHLCVCQAAAGSAGRSLRGLLCAPEPDADYRKLDEARSMTARLLGRIVLRKPIEDAEAGFSSVSAPPRLPLSALNAALSPPFPAD